MLFVAILAIMMVAAAVSDLRTRTIPNSLNAAIALLAIPYWFVVGLSPWPDMALQFGVAFMVFTIFAILFTLGAMGGGDVKMIGATTLWLPPEAVIHFLLVMTISGGFLSLLFLVLRVLRRFSMSGSQPQGKIELPYGVAIAFAGLWEIYQRYVNHFSLVRELSFVD